MRRKNVKRGLPFTVMVVGCSGLGKTTFISTLVGRNMAGSVEAGVEAPALDFDGEVSSNPQKTVSLVPHVVGMVFDAAIAMNRSMHSGNSHIH
jgi:septin family protein